MRKILIICALLWMIPLSQAYGSGCLKWISVEDYGATGGDTSDDTAAIQAAFDSGCNIHFPNGAYYISDDIVCSTNGQLISGSKSGPGPWASTRIIIDDDYKADEEAVGVFVIDSLTKGPVFSDLYIRFEQPYLCKVISQSDVSNCDDAFEYPPLFYINDAPGTEVNNCMFTLAYNVAKVYGDASGVTFDNIRVSSMNTTIYIGAATGSIVINNMHFWPYDTFEGGWRVANWLDCTATTCGPLHDVLRNVRSGACIEIKSGATVFISNFFSDKGRVLDIDGDESGNYPKVFCTSLTTEALTFPVIMRGGFLHFTRSSLSMHNNLGTPTQRYYFEETEGVAMAPMSLLGGRTVISNSQIWCRWEPPAAPAGYQGNIKVMSGATLQLTNCYFYIDIDADDHTMLIKDGGVVMATGCIFTGPTGSGNRPGELFQVEPGGLISISGSSTVAADGVRGLLELQADGKHNIFGNRWNDWVYDDPPASSLLVFEYNTDY